MGKKVENQLLKGGEVDYEFRILSPFREGTSQQREEHYRLLKERLKQERNEILPMPDYMIRHTDDYHSLMETYLYEV